MSPLAQKIGLKLGEMLGEALIDELKSAKDRRDAIATAKVKAESMLRFEELSIAKHAAKRKAKRK